MIFSEKASHLMISPSLIIIYFQINLYTRWYSVEPIFIIKVSFEMVILKQTDLCLISSVDFNTCFAMLHKCIRKCFDERITYISLMQS